MTVKQQKKTAAGPPEHDPNLGGTKFDAGKPRYGLIPPIAMDMVARVFTYGAQKYGDHNWKRGIDLERLLDATHRHVWAIQRGEWFDPETGLPHAAHAICELAMMIDMEDIECQES